MPLNLIWFYTGWLGTFIQVFRVNMVGEIRTEWPASANTQAGLGTYNALGKILSNWVFWAIFTRSFLIVLGIRIFHLDTLFC